MAKVPSPRILMIMPDAFHLGWMGETQRLFQFAEAFNGFGYEVVLLAGRMTRPEVQEQIDQQFPGKVLRTSHTGAYPRLLDLKPITRRAWRALWKARGAEYYAARLSFGWAEVLDSQKVVREFKRRGLRPDLIWGVSAGYLDGAMAADRIANALNVPWVLELRDPPRGCGLGPDRTTVCKEFFRLVKASARLVVTTNSYQRCLIEDFRIDAQRVHVIYRAYEGEICAQGDFERDSVWRLFYAGSLDGGRSVSPLISGFHRALNSQPGLREHVSIEIAGTGPGVAQAQNLASALGVSANVCIHGYITKERVNELSRLTRVLVVVQNEETSKLQIPGKIFECLRLGKPILAIMPECEAADILRRSGLGFIHASQDIDGIANMLIKLWSDWRAGCSSVQMDREYVSQFSVKHLPEKLRLVLEGLL